MNLLVVQIGEACFAFAEHQVQQIGPWRPREGDLCIELASALNVDLEGGCERALRVVRERGRPLEFGIPSSIRQRAATPGSLSQVPQLLKRFSAPPWVAGFYRSEEELATVIDLRRLADAVDPDP